MRDAQLTNAVVLKRLAQLDKKLLEHDVVLQDVVEKLLPLLNPPVPPPKPRIGFRPGGL
jgi:isochorismate synthase EntC